jgi:hypothetical protein
MAIDTIKSTAVLDGAIATADIADANITTAKIADDAVTTDKLANSINTDIAAKLPLAGGTMTGVVAGFTSTGIDDNATSNAITIDSSENVGVGASSISSWTKLQVNGTAGAQNTSSQTLYLTAPSETANEGVGIRMSAASGSHEAVGIIGMVNNATGNSGAMTFHTYDGGGTIPERVRILSEGGITFNGDTATANALNDYEEGSWTPLAKGTSTNPSVAPTLIGRYTKIGNQVNIYLKFDAVSFAGAAGGVYFDGLPFSASGATVHGIGSIMQYNVCTFNDSPCLYVSGSSVYIYHNVSGGTWDNSQHTGSSAVYMNACVTYTTNS